MPSLFDLHADNPSAVFRSQKPVACFSDNFERQVQVSAFFIPPNEPNPYTLYRNMLREFKCINTIPINDLNADKTVLFSLEGGSAFERDLARLDSLKADGVSSVLLSWNYDNSLAGGALGYGGLTLKGVEAIGRLNCLGMALDLSHLNERSFFSAAERADAVLASHSNSYSVHPHPRNLSDEALKLIRDKNGIVGINFYPVFLGGEDVKERIYEHIFHMLDLGMTDNIAIGSDFDGAEMSPSLSKTEDVFDLYFYLSDKFSDKGLCDKIFFDNAFRFYQKLFDNRVVM